MYDVKKILFRQLEMMFAVDENEWHTILLYFERALQETIGCISQRNDRYHMSEKVKSLNPFNSCDYMVFLYYLSHELYREGEEEFASRVYYLNKSLNCVELFYAIELPKVWGAEHPLGAVMGRAKYGERFFFYQGCTVGANLRFSNQHPIIGDDVTMCSNSKILGSCHVGNRCIIAANAYIQDEDVPDDSIVFGQHPNITIKKRINYMEYSSVFEKTFVK